MGKVCLKHILGLLWKIVENMFFLDIEHVGMENRNEHVFMQPDCFRQPKTIRMCHFTI